MKYALAFIVADLARLQRRRFDVAAKALGITGPQFRVLFMVQASPGVTQGRLADAMDVEPITTCRMVDRMEAAGLIERRRDPADRRAWLLHLTDAAGPLLDEALEVARELTMVMTMGLAAEEIEQVERVLEQVRLNLLDDGLFEQKETKIG
ncbi:MAG TPA: MarR family transcriptional regulator [Sphingobium sp.]